MEDSLTLHREQQLGDMDLIPRKTGMTMVIIVEDFRINMAKQKVNVAYVETLGLQIHGNMKHLEVHLQLEPSLIVTLWGKPCL